MDATNSFFPMDFGAMPMQTDGTNGLTDNAPATSLPGNGNAFQGNGGVFMGVGGPDPKTSSNEGGYASGFMLPKTG